MTTLRSLPEALLERAEKTPDRVFLSDTNGQHRTYSQLLLQITRWSKVLQRLGVQEHDTVIAQLPSRLETAEIWLATAWARALFAPVNKDYLGRILAQQVGVAKACLAITTPEWLPRFLQIENRCPDLEKILVVCDEHWEAPASSDRLEIIRTCDLLGAPTGLETLSPPPGIHNTSSILYTSGTTGPSKAVIVPWGQWANSNLLTDLDEGDVYYSPFPFYHGSGQIALIFMAEIGGKVVIKDGFSVNQFWDDIETNKCTVTLFVPTMISWLLDRPESQGEKTTSLKHAMTAPLNENSRVFAERFSVQLRTLFGMTEIGHPFAGPVPDNFEHLKSCGTCRPGYEVRLVDELDRPVLPGQPGELIVRTDTPWTLNQGYLGQPEKTAESWRNGWFHTGDVFKQDADGRFYFVDRKKDALRRRGENISSFEVEQYICDHKDIKEAVAIGVNAAAGEQEIKVFLISNRDDLDPKKLLEDFDASMPKLMRPRYVELVDDFPRTPATGRVQKAKLRENPLNASTWDRETGRWIGETVKQNEEVV